MKFKSDQIVYFNLFKVEDECHSMTNRIGCCASPRKPGSKTTTGSRVTNGRMNRGGVTEVPPLQSDQSKSLTAWDTYEVPPRQRNETMTIPPKCAHFLSPVCTNKRRTLWTHPLCSSIFFFNFKYLCDVYN